MYQCLKDKSHQGFTSDALETNRGTAYWISEGDLENFTESDGNVSAISEILCAECGSSIEDI